MHGSSAGAGSSLQGLHPSEQERANILCVFQLPAEALQEALIKHKEVAFPPLDVCIKLQRWILVIERKRSAGIGLTATYNQGIFSIFCFHIGIFQ